MNHDRYDDDYIADILARTKTIAVVGASANPSRPSHGVMQFLVAQGYEIYPVNPGHAGAQILGRQVYARLADVPVAIDMVDVFRASAAVGGVVDEALALDPLPRVIWTQLGVRDDGAAARAEKAGVQVVMNRCPKIEISRLGGPIRMRPG
ncbi:MAG TPA: CoA-binding protein [Rhizobiaceae bacterium]|nr:CoA-binding protein [Rhizobiaceae bacterium]